MIQTTIECPFKTSILHTASSHGWVNLPPWDWDSANGQLSRCERIDDGTIIDIEVSQSDLRSVAVEILADELDEQGLESIRATVKRWLSIDWNPISAIRLAETLDSDIAKHIEAGGGRFLRGSTFYEDFVKTVCTINTNWTSTVRMISRLVAITGDMVFPVPSDIINMGEDFLRRETGMGFRAKTVCDSTLYLLEHGFVDERGNVTGNYPSFVELTSLRGIGPYCASHMLMLNHDYRHIPIDSEVSRYCKQVYGIEPENIPEFFAPWGNYRALGYKMARILNRG